MKSNKKQQWNPVVLKSECRECAKTWFVGNRRKCEDCGSTLIETTTVPKHLAARQQCKSS